MDDRQNILEALDGHIAAFWSENRRTIHTWDRGPILDQIPGFHVVRIAPKTREEAWVYASVGASVAYPVGGLEFFIMSPIATDRHIETLAMVAHFQSFDAHRLNIGSTVNLGQPWMGTSECDHMVVTLPYPFGPALEVAPEAANGARFYWLVPISKTEASFIRRDGFEEFGNLIEASQVDVIDPLRPLVVN